MNRFFLLTIALICYCCNLQSQEIEYSRPVNTPESCTSIMVGKKASADGSVMTSHTCDGNYRTWMEIVPATRYERDTTVAIYNGRMHTEYPADRTNMELKGTIPEARSTYQFLNTAYPCLNEKQLGIGETTISGRKELQNKKGMFMIEELEKIALQRCTTAREAIRLIGQLVAEHGYGDSGECLTIADPNEVWHFEVFGEGQDKIGGVWAAVRIPDDHVGVSANISRISTLDLKDEDHYMASKNVFSVAKKMGFWDGKEPFKFWKAYSGGNYFGEPKAFSIREYFILNALAPSLKLSYDAEELPISVKPDKAVAVTDVMALLRQTYEGTEWDMTSNLESYCQEQGDTKDRHHHQPGGKPVDGDGYGQYAEQCETGDGDSQSPGGSSAMFLLARDTASQLAAGCSRRRCLAVVRQSGTESAHPDLCRNDRPAGCFRYLRAAPPSRGCHRLEIPDGKQVGYGSLGIDQGQDQRCDSPLRGKGLIGDAFR